MLDRPNVVVVGSTAELAELLTLFVWPPDAAFALGGTTLVNVSTSPGAIQEFAVVHGGRQVESITVGACSREALRRSLAGALATAARGPAKR